MCAARSAGETGGTRRCAVAVDLASGSSCAVGSVGWAVSRRVSGCQFRAIRFPGPSRCGRPILLRTMAAAAIRFVRFNLLHRDCRLDGGVESTAVSWSPAVVVGSAAVPGSCVVMTSRCHPATETTLRATLGRPGTCRRSSCGRHAASSPSPMTPRHVTGPRGSRCHAADVEKASVSPRDL